MKNITKSKIDDSNQNIKEELEKLEEIRNEILKETNNNMWR